MVGLLWTFFKRRIQPLKARVHPMFEYTGSADPTRELEKELAESEVKVRVSGVLRLRISIEASLTNCPLARSLTQNPRHVSLFALSLFLQARGRAQPTSFFTLVFALHQDLQINRCYLPLSEDAEKKKAKWAQAERQKERKKEKDQRKAAEDKARYGHARTGADTPSEMLEATTQETSKDEGMEAWTNVVLEPRKRPTDELVGEVSSK
ncbi:hypothetical protein BAE44_0010326 [Dichanthelium oligosanthes]|uniref:Uncharacterized protein n=1 Tax=Dichanthelium oligosanthes TaxID=888268 RepID=A0A1E5VU62_9POAL|nr:hypothetical protein BAE44_0010326 [Dichanthelium oligosanthes]